MHLPIRYWLEFAGGDPAGGAQENPQPGAPAARLRIVPFVPGTDDAAVARLAAACRAGTGGDGGTFRPAGILAELTGRPGRETFGWLAWPAAVAGSGAGVSPVAAGVPGDCPLGLAAAVVRPAAGPSAFSIAWLLVHPLARRRGVATALVARAVAAARAAGARGVSAETHPTWDAADAFWRAIGFRSGGTAADGAAATDAPRQNRAKSP